VSEVDDVRAALDRLQAESEARRAELREIAAQLPATVSRTALLRSMAVDLRHAPDKGMIARRGLRKIGRVPRRLARTILRRDR
jgi:hypothetical protein